MVGDDPPGASASTDRRSFLQSVAAAAIGGGLAAELSTRELIQPAEARLGRTAALATEGGDPDETFPQSVMSGGPTTSGAILWTRIAPEAYTEGVDVGVEVARDSDFNNTVVAGSVPAKNVKPRNDYALKVDLDGRLDSNTFYYYRFVYDGVASRTGRCRTLPASGDDISDVSFGVVTCQDYQNGYYGAYAHLADEDVDYLLHMGDFIYESADGAYLSPTESIRDGRDFELPSGNALAETVEDFRHLWQTYKSDRLLQQGLEQHTIIAGWDDHEIGNNRYWDYVEDAPVVPEKDRGSNPEFAIELTANGIQAWVEHMPARVEYDPSTDDLHEQFQLWRTIEFGDLVDLVVTDERLFRDGPPCPDRSNATCFSEEEKGRTMLGDRQKQWFKDAVSTSDARWTTWMNEVLTMPLTAGDGWNQVEFLHDSWDGFQAERYELLQHIQQASPRNFVTLTGDLHCSMAGYMKAGYNEIDWQWSWDRVGVELMTPAVTSVNAASVVDFPSSWDGEALNDVAKSQNDHIEYINWYRQGYAVVTFSEDGCRYTAYEVDKETDSADAQRTKIAQYYVPDGTIELQEEYNIFEENAGSGLL